MEIHDGRRLRITPSISFTVNTELSGATRLSPGADAFAVNPRSGCP
jgi:hypothetical protein